MASSPRRRWTIGNGLQEVSAALKNQGAQGNICIFGTSWSSQVLIFDPQDSEKVDSSDDDEGSQFRG